LTVGRLVKAPILLFLATLAIAGSDLPQSDLPRPWIDRVLPLGAQLGSTVTIELHGEYLSNVTDVRFDTTDLRWVQTKEADSGHVVGLVEVAENAALGPHRLQLFSQDGPSNSRLFNVTQFPALAEAEPNDRLNQAQAIGLTPQILDGYMQGRVDIDTYTFAARKGERWTFDVRSMEYGSHLECELTLFDAEGNRVAYNDDRNDIDETPFIEHTFGDSGAYYLQLDQYRGPQNVDCGRNCGYMLRVSQLPLMEAVSPLGARRGTTSRIALVGSALDSVESIYLQRVRGAENYRMTYPYTMPIDIGPAPKRSTDIPRITGTVISRSAGRLEAKLDIPPDAATGLWRVWVKGPESSTDGLSFEVSDSPEFSEADSPHADWRQSEVIINGSLDSEGDEDVYELKGVAGEPLQILTLAAQLGLPLIDTVLELYDAEGKLVAEHDDVMTGQGTVIGNPDSSLFFVPEQDGPLKLVVRDRTGRGGPTFQYRLKIKSARPGFQLLVEPENFTVPIGSSAELAVLLIRQPGFEDDVEIWVDGLPGQAKPLSGIFRSDQFFGPSADGDNIIIPEVRFRIEAPESLSPGVFPFQVLGRAGIGGPVVEAHTSLWVGPPRKRNDIRRPLPAIAMHVVEPFDARLSTDTRITIEQGETTEIKIDAKNIPENAALRIANAPSGVSYRVVSLSPDQIVLAIEANGETKPGSTTVSVEANVSSRWAATAPLTMAISANKKNLTTSR
jgi:hypothetical protein